MPKLNGKSKVFLSIIAVAIPTVTIALSTGRNLNKLETIQTQIADMSGRHEKSLDKLDADKLDKNIFDLYQAQQMQIQQSIEGKLDRIERKLDRPP